VINGYCFSLASNCSKFNFAKTGVKRPSLISASHAFVYYSHILQDRINEVVVQAADRTFLKFCLYPFATEVPQAAKL
jgi:hypothetical protein